MPSDSQSVRSELTVRRHGLPCRCGLTIHFFPRGLYCPRQRQSLDGAETISGRRGEILRLAREQGLRFLSTSSLLPEGEKCGDAMRNLCFLKFLPQKFGLLKNNAYLCIIAC